MSLSVGYPAIKNSNIIDVNRLRGYAIEVSGEPDSRPRGPAPDPRSRPFAFRLRGRTCRPPRPSGQEIDEIDPAIGEFRVHYAGFFDPGFGHGGKRQRFHPLCGCGSAQPRCAVLEDGQPVGRLVYEKLAGAACNRDYRRRASSCRRAFPRLAPRGRRSATSHCDRFISGRQSTSSWQKGGLLGV